MKIQKTLLMLFLSVAIMVCFGSAQANVISGNLWHVAEAAAQNAIPSNLPGGTPDVTFDVNSPLDFYSYSPISVGNWLATGSAFNIVENTAGTLSSLMDDYTTGTLIEFTGFVSVTNGQTFTVTHDDGLTLIISSINLGFSTGPTAPVTSTATYTGPSGNLPFQLVYGESDSGAAVLQIDLPFSNVPSTAVPEPSTMLLLGCGIIGLAVANRRQLER
jgi:PEP-CTERM motif